MGAYWYGLMGLHSGIGVHQIYFAGTPIVNKLEDLYSLL
jgi:hypothetical protein